MGRAALPSPESGPRGGAVSCPAAALPGPPFLLLPGRPSGRGVGCAGPGRQGAAGSGSALPHGAGLTAPLPCARGLPAPLSGDGRTCSGSQTRAASPIGPFWGVFDLLPAPIRGAPLRVPLCSNCLGAPEPRARPGPEKRVCSGLLSPGLWRGPGGDGDDWGGAAVRGRRGAGPGTWSAANMAAAGRGKLAEPHCEHKAKAGEGRPGSAPPKPTTPAILPFSIWPFQVAPGGLSASRPFVVCSPRSTGYRLCVGGHVCACARVFTYGERVSAEGIIQPSVRLGVERKKQITSIASLILRKSFKNVYSV